MVPVLAARQQDIKTSYAITINGVEKERLQLRHKEGLINNVEIDVSNYNWSYESKVPKDWTKIILPKKFDWIYKDSRNTVVASFQKENIDISLGYESLFIPIIKKNEFHLYQRVELTRDGYRLDLIQKESGFPSWAKYLLFLTLFGAGYAQS